MKYAELTRETFDQQVQKEANAYSCCWYHGYGKYTTNYFPTLKEAHEERDEIRAAFPHARILIYAIVVGPLGPTHQTLVP